MSMAEMTKTYEVTWLDRSIGHGAGSYLLTDKVKCLKFIALIN